MDLWPLPIFPDGSLASSVITTVWVGAFVVCLFNLRFGWVLSGLVVPGYIVPLLIAKPVSALVVLGEASLTYAIFWLLSERWSGPTRWSSFFGRDRFMGLILVSVAVRVGLDGTLLPLLAEHLNERMGWQLDWRHNLHSFGLIVIALLANQFWKPGYVRGMAQALVVLAVTFLIVRFGLMELTNFRIGAVVYLYEDFASSVLASPKAYIILITTCFIASRMNLRYGWDFSGILIPALLALQWYQPWKIVTSLVEALIIYFFASAILGSRAFAGATIEGGRKILLFFNLSFLYKLVVGHAVAFAGIEYRISDFYGFGYLLPTLIALKAHDKDILPRVVRATTQISLMGALAGSLIGFLLTFVLPERRNSETATAPVANEPSLTSARIAAVAGGGARIDRAAGSSTRVAAQHVAGFKQALRLIERNGAGGEARALLREAGFVMRPLRTGRVAVTPEDGSGFALLFDRTAARELAVHVTGPASAPGLAMAGHALFERQRARWLLIGGGTVSADGAPGMAPARLFTQAIDAPRVEVRSTSKPAPTLQLAGESGSRLELDELRAIGADVRLTFGLADAVASQIALPPAAIQRLIASSDPIGAAAPPPVRYSAAELAFIRYDLLDPLLALGPSRVPGAAAMAAAMGIDFSDRTRPGGKPVVVLRRTGQRGQHYYIRPAGTGPVLQYPMGEVSAQNAARLFGDLDGRALLIVPDARWLDGEEAQLLPLITQALMARAPKGTPTMQLRRVPNFAAGRGPLLAVDRAEPAGRFGDQLTRLLRRSGIAARPVGQGPGDAGLEIAPSAQLRYLQQAYGSRIAVLWVDGE